MGRCRCYSEFVLENRPKIALNQYWYFGVVYNNTMCILLKVVGYYDMSVLTTSVMGFQKKCGWGGWVG